MTWNYRIVKRSYPNSKWDDTYSIHEAYYNEEGQADSITVEGIEPVGETPKELKQSLEMMLKALDKPILNYEDF